MAKKKSVRRCRFSSKLLMRFRHKRVNEQELEKTEKHLAKCQECRNKFVSIFVFEDRIRAEVDNMLYDMEQEGDDPSAYV